MRRGAPPRGRKWPAYPQAAKNTARALKRLVATANHARSTGQAGQIPLVCPGPGPASRRRL